MRRGPILRLILATVALTATLATPAAAKKDKCLKAIVKALQSAGTADITQVLKGQAPSSTISITARCPTLPSGIGYTGCPGIANCPSDSDTSVAGYQKCINCILQAAARYAGEVVHPGKCGNGTVDAPFETCDPAQTTSSCKASETCGAVGAPNQCNCSTKLCGNGVVNAGEACDPAASPNGCTAGNQCIASGANACTCQPTCGRLTFTFGTGTTSCGGSGLGTPASPPFSGGLFDAIGGAAGSGSKIADLGLGCLYFGGAAATIVSPGLIPDGASTQLTAICDTANPENITLTPTTAQQVGKAACTAAPAANAARHCANDPSRGCVIDTDCDLSGVSKPCQPDPQCFFGPPLSLPNLTSGFAFTSACVINVIAQDAAGTANSRTGAMTLDTYRLTSLIYVTGHFTNLCTGGTTPGAACTNIGDVCPGGGTCEALSCPVCVNGTCNEGQKVGQACAPTGSKGTTLDCPPDGFLGPLDINLAPLTTGATTTSAADGLYCPAPFCLTGAGACTIGDPMACGGIGICTGQQHAGAFGKNASRSITETGSPAGDLTDHLSHDASLAYIFCIPPPGEPATTSSDLPGPGAVSLKGKVQLLPAAP